MWCSVLVMKAHLLEFKLARSLSVTKSWINLYILFIWRYFFVMLIWCPKRWYISRGVHTLILVCLSDLSCSNNTPDLVWTHFFLFCFFLSCIDLGLCVQVNLKFCMRSIEMFSQWQWRLDCQWKTVFLHTFSKSRFVSWNYLHQDMCRLWSLSPILRS